MKKLLLIASVLFACSGYARNKLYKNDSVVITNGKMTYPTSVTPFVTDTTGKPNYTDFSSIENWSAYGGESQLNTRQIRAEIDTLVAEKTFAVCTNAEKNVASEWFVVDESDRDTRHTAAQQETNAERMIRSIQLGFSERDIIACRDAIKDADKTIIDNVISAQSMPSLRMQTGSYTGDGTTSMGVTGVGFQPIFLKIWMRHTTSGEPCAIHETTDSIVDDNAAGMAILHSTTANHHVSKTNAIISLDADGFTIDDNGADEHPNKLNQVYNYWVIGY